MEKFQTGNVVKFDDKLWIVAKFTNFREEGILLELISLSLPSSTRITHAEPVSEMINCDCDSGYRGNWPDEDCLNCLGTGMAEYEQPGVSDVKLVALTMDEYLVKRFRNFLYGFDK